MGCSRRPAGSRSSNKGAARPLLPPTSVAGAPRRAPAPRCGPGQDFPLRSFGKLAPRPVTLGGGAGKGVTRRGAHECWELRHCLFPLPTARARAAVAPRPSSGPRVAPPQGPRGFEVPARRARPARGSTPLPADSGGVPAPGREWFRPRGPPAAAGTLSRAPEGGNCITVS